MRVPQVQACDHDVDESLKPAGVAWFQWRRGFQPYFEIVFWVNG